LRDHGPASAYKLMPPVASPKLSVVLPTRGTEPALSQVLLGLARQASAELAVEVLIGLESTASDEVLTELERTLARLGLSGGVVRGSCPGASANRNAGVRKARAAIVLFLDDDTVPGPGLLAEHLRWHTTHPQAEVSVLGRVRWAPELGRSAFRAWLDQGIQFDHAQIAGIDAGWGRYVTANVSTKRGFVIEVGGFDEVNLPYLYEDLDFGYRASRQGLRLLYNRAAVVDHLNPATPEGWRRRLPQLARAERRFTELHPEVDPWFLRLFEAAAAAPPASGRGRYLARWVRPTSPLLGPVVWASADLYFRQLLADDFLREWELAVSEETT
jgi:glycosyltransferase involved in cell wall biosynthesis